MTQQGLQCCRKIPRRNEQRIEFVPSATRDVEGAQLVPHLEFFEKGYLLAVRAEQVDSWLPELRADTALLQQNVAESRVPAQNSGTELRTTPAACQQ